MKALRLLILLAASCATSTVTTAWAAEPAPARRATQSSGESAAPNGNEPSEAKQGTQSEDEAAAQEQKAPAPKPKAPGKGGSPERFVPSEQVRADFDVSFPIDI